VFTLSETEIGILPVPVTKQNSHGWSVVDSTGKVICIRALNIEAAVNNIPTASLVVCSSVLLARLAPLSAAYSSLLVGMMMLLPVHIIRVTRGGNIKMKHWLLGCGLVSDSQKEFSKPQCRGRNTDYISFPNLKRVLWP
jgi:hypothetical protein